MGTLLCKTIPFVSKAVEGTLVSGTLDSIREKVDVEPRVFKGVVYNEGSNQVVVKLYGSADGSSWTQMASVTVPAGGKGILNGSVKGGQSYYKITTTGDTWGRIELFDLSSAYDRG